MTKFTKGEIVVCILNNRATLTVGKEYDVISCDRYGNVEVLNDYGEHCTYTSERFISKSNFRNLKLNLILDKE